MISLPAIDSHGLSNASVHSIEEKLKQATRYGFTPVEILDIQMVLNGLYS